MDGLGRYQGKWNKSDRERQTLYDITYGESKNRKKLVNITKKRLTDIEKKTGGYQWWEGKYRWGVQTIGCKIGYKDVLYNMGNIAKIL